MNAIQTITRETKPVVVLAVLKENVTYYDYLDGKAVRILKGSQVMVDVSERNNMIGFSKDPSTQKMRAFWIEKFEFELLQ